MVRKIAVALAAALAVCGCATLADRGNAAVGAFLRYLEALVEDRRADPGNPERDVLTRLIARQAEMQYAYEDRIADLRAKVDRTTSRQLLDQEQFEQKLDDLLRRQATRSAGSGRL